MLKTSMLFQEESRIFNELLSRFDALSGVQNAGGGRDAGMVHEGLAGASGALGAGRRGANTGTPGRHVVSEEEDLGRG
jgi:hypothetical protein